MASQSMLLCKDYDTLQSMSSDRLINPKDSSTASYIKVVLGHLDGNYVRAYS